MPSLDPTFLNRLSFRQEQAAMLAALGEARGRQVLYAQQKPEVLRSLRQVAVIESSESSNRLEGILAPHERIEALVLQPTEPRDRSEQEIAGYRDAIAMIHESHASVPFTVDFLRRLHGMLYRYHPGSGGSFKSVDNDIVERNVAGVVTRLIFRPTSAAETPRAMDALLSLHREAAARIDLSPVVTIPLTILDLLCIHPFLDGNGRVARLATLLLLYRSGFEVGRYISLERVIEQSKAGYHETLERSSAGWHEGRHDPHPWLDYFWGVLLRAYREFEERVGALDQPSSKTTLVRNAVLRRTGPFGISDIEREVPTVSRELIRLVLRELKRQGHLALEGRGRGARWLRVEA